MFAVGVDGRFDRRDQAVLPHAFDELTCYFFSTIQMFR